MVRARGLVFAGLLVGLAGCTLDSLSLAVIGPSGREQTLNAPFDSVCASFQAALHQQGMIYNYSHGDQSLRIESTTRGGQKFVLLLKRKKRAAGEQTVVRIDWAKDADEKFWLALLDAAGGAAGPPRPGLMP